MKYFYKYAAWVLSLLPISWQRWIYDRMVSESIVFHVLSGSLWSAYEIIGNEEDIIKRIPAGFELAPTTIFKNDDAPKKWLFFNFFRVRSSYFEGTRLEIATMIRRKEDGDIHFIILEYYTDTISHDPLHPFRPPDDYTFQVDPLRLYKMDDRFEMNILFPIDQPQFQALDHAFVMANQQIYYAHSDRPDILFFDKEEAGNVVVIDCVYNVMNDLWPACRRDQPDLQFVYPHPVSFLIFPQK